MHRIVKLTGLLVLCVVQIFVSCGEGPLGYTEELVAPNVNPVSDITDFSATISGVVRIPANATADLEYGIQYSTYMSFNKNVRITQPITDLDAERRFSITIFPLIPQKTYYCRSYIKMNGEEVYGELQSFKTMVLEPTVPAGFENLSKSYGANCYIVSKSGKYCIPAVKGNNANSSSGWVRDTYTVQVLWESFGTASAPSVGDLIKSVSYDDGYIAFETADDFKEGNAVIAALDRSENIVWSWHIWFTDPPKSQVYYNNAGTMMDRNLGATSAAPGDPCALGLLYQWGRKDPFLGACVIHNDPYNPDYEIEEVEAKSTITWPKAIMSDRTEGTVEYTVAHPTTLIYASNNQPSWRDWHYDKPSVDLWSSRKSIYDPCPEGWRVPDGGSDGIWSKALGITEPFVYENIYDTTNWGINFSGILGGDAVIWYPSTSRRDFWDNRVVAPYSLGEYWSATNNNDGALSFWIRNLGDYSDDQYHGYITVGIGCDREIALSVRCAKE